MHALALPEDAPAEWLASIAAAGLLAATLLPAPTRHGSVDYDGSIAPSLSSGLARAIRVAGQSLLVGAPLLHAVAVLLGADVLCWRTAGWAAAQACVTFAPLVAATGSAGSAVALLVDADGWLSRVPTTALPGILSLVCAWLACAVIPLDWGAPWQAWPAPAVYGCVIGAAVGYCALAGCAPRRRWGERLARAL